MMGIGTRNLCPADDYFQLFMVQMYIGVTVGLTYLPRPDQVAFVFIFDLDTILLWVALLELYCILHELQDQRRG
jgi:hypothetical protein